ncbi:GDYXXLXY domain-containing protein [Hyphococcus flavus]|uniref:GDYXXLXY domain-containing protein n=1 Tax=Hyphococcus flavus TaxID=1866326 RepID=A0AAE9ZLB8_9PROT|nr:GDYXXLXY domain-containing protein [Hyphococcus flavus]WDI32745.1 GDYXXLXY domain-containing protein [Hyphococcus flavus]
MSTEKQTPWYVETFLAIGGWIAGLLAAIAIFAMAAGLVASVGKFAPEIGAFISVMIGAGFVFFGVSMMQPDRGDFRRHFAIASTAAGLTAATAGVWFLLFSLFGGANDAAAMTVGVAGLITSALLTAAGFFIARIMRDGIFTFLITLAVYGVATAALIILRDDTGFGWRTDIYLAAPVALLGCWLFINAPQDNLSRPAGAAMLIAPMLHYAIARNAQFIFGAGADPQIWLIGEALFAAAALYCLWILRRRYAALPLLASGALVLAAIWFLPSAGAVAIIMLLSAIAANHRGFAVVSIAAVIWFISRFYYDLSMTLLEKSALMAAMGAATLFGALIFNRFQSGVGAAKSTPQRHRLLAAFGFAALLVVALTLVNRSVWRLETQFRDATEIYLPLGPRDPRSILQGDYMVLNFRNDIYPPFDAIEALPRGGEIFLKLDENNVAAFSRIPAAGDAPGPDEIRIDYVKTNSRRIRYVPQSFFFQEGEAELFQPARFAIVKVTDDGNARLTALADENRQRIGPGD